MEGLVYYLFKKSLLRLIYIHLENLENTKEKKKITSTIVCAERIILSILVDILEIIYIDTDLGGRRKR